MIAAEREDIVDLVMSREEPLRLTGGFEPLHRPFSPPRRLVRILRSVVHTLVLAVLDPGHRICQVSRQATRCSRSGLDKRPYLL